MQKKVDTISRGRSRIVDEARCMVVIRNGSLPGREVITGLGPVSVCHQHIPELVKGVCFIDVVNEQSLDKLKSSATKSPTTHTEIDT